MRTLYESILYTDQDVKDQIVRTLLPISIVKYLKECFNKHLERETNVIRIGKFYPLGCVDKNLYNKDNVQETEKFLTRSIKQMIRKVKKDIKYPIKTYIDENKDIKLSIRKYTVTFEADTKFEIEFSIHTSIVSYTIVKVTYIDIWTRSEKIVEIINNQ